MTSYAYNHAVALHDDHELRQKGWLGSIVVHAAVIAWLLLYPHVAVREAALTEFTWLEEGSPAEEVAQVVAPPIEAAAPVEVVQEQPSPQPTTPERFERVESADAEVEPKPQSLAARDDRMSDRLAALRQNRPTLAVKAPTSSSLLKSPASETPAVTAEKKELLRENQGSPSKPVELKRSQGLSRAPKLASVKPNAPAVSTAAIVPPDADMTVRRTLAGAALAGPAADRPVKNYIMPEYPEWAKREGIEASVTLNFVVLPDGKVKKNVMVHRTSGYEDFDRRAQQALRMWRFQALAPGSTQEQWGSITMHFRLRD